MYFGLVLQPTALVHKAYLGLAVAKWVPLGAVGAVLSQRPLKPCGGRQKFTEYPKKWL